MTPAFAGLSPTRAVLPNGVTLLLRRTTTAPAATLHLSIRAGAVYDPPEQQGTAHFVARLLDRGTDRRSADAIADELDGRGVSLTVSVSRHTVSLVATCLAEDLPAILDVMGDLIMRPAFPPAEVETRRQAILTLLGQDEDQPAAVATDLLMQMLYGGHPYGWRVRGTAAAVERLDARALRRFHHERFVPPAVSLAVVGDVEDAEAIDAAARVFGDWRGDAPSDPALPDVSPLRDRRVRVASMMGKAQAHIAYGFTTVRRADPAYDACWVMNTVLGQYGLGGRLGHRIRETEGMAYYAYSALEASVAPGPLVVHAGVSAAHVERVVSLIDEELDRFAGEGPTDVEVGESVQYLIGSMPRMLETSAGIAQFLQTCEFFGLGLDYDLRAPERLRQVTRDTVHVAARRLLAPSRAAVAVAGPYGGDPARLAQPGGQ